MVELRRGAVVGRCGRVAGLGILPRVLKYHDAQTISVFEVLKDVGRGDARHDPPLKLRPQTQP